MLVSKNNYIHSRGGKLDQNTDHQPTDIDAIIQAVKNSGKQRLIIHFHGGLVSKGDGLAIAERLIPVYEPGGYPLFFVWESGIWETVRNNLGDISREPIFRQLVRKVLEYVLGSVPEMEHKISEYLTGGRFFSSIEMSEGQDMIEMVIKFLGDDVLMYASDYPHFECRFPNSVDYFFGWQLSDPLRRKMLWENPVRFYGEP